jgi:hypothetical protein
MAFWTYCRAVIRHWTALATSSIGVAVLAVVTQGFGISVPGWVYLAVFGGGVVWAGFRTWEDKRNDALRLEVAAEELRNQLAVAPLIRIVFAGDGSAITVNVRQPTVRSPEEKAALLQAQREKHPLAASSADSVETPFGTINLRGLFGSEELPAAEFNAELSNYFERYAGWLEDVDRHATTMSRSVELLLAVRNDGTAPARNVDVALVAGPGCAFAELDDKDLELPRKPKLPSRAISPYDRYSSALNFISPEVVPFATHFEDPRIGVERLELTVWTASLKPGRPIEVPAFLLLWGRETSQVSLEYEITAEELRAPLKGQLMIEVRAPEVG